MPQSDVLIAFTAIARNLGSPLSEVISSTNRANHQGTALETLVIEALAGVLGSNLEKEDYESRVSEALVWQGSANMTPDGMVRGSGIAFEVKKHERANQPMQLNSSAPRQILNVQDSRVPDEARRVEPWVEREFVYFVGHVEKNLIRRMWIVYGDCIAANEGTYSEVYETLREAISVNVQAPWLDMNTNEFARAMNIDAQNRTNLRVRPMWSLEGPEVSFAGLVGDLGHPGVCLILRESTYVQMPDSSKALLQSLNMSNLTSRVVSIPDPDSLVETIDARLITFHL